MKRLLFVDHVNRILGGAEFNLLELLETLARSDCRSLACACPADSPLTQALERLRLECFDYRLPPSLNQFRLVGRRFSLAAGLRGLLALRQAARRLHAICLQFRPRAVISCTNKDHLGAVAACRRSALPSIWWVNDVLSPDFFPWPARAAFRRGALRGTARVVAVSDFARQSLRQLGLPDSCLTTIHNGIPLDRYRRTTPGHLRQPLGLPATEPLIGAVGRFTPWKGQDFFLEIAEAWIQHRPAGHFVLIGQAAGEDQPFETRLRQFVAARSLAARVHFFPFQQPLAPALSDLDVLVHPSTRPEPFGRVIIEAMAAGTPVVAARAGGVPEIITHDRDGLLAEPGNLRHYLAQLARIVNSPAFRQSLAQAAHQTVHRRFTVERVARQFEGLVDAAAG